jgi:ankyrin repeat protein
MTNDMIQTKITTSDKTKIILSAKRNDFRSMKELLEKNPSLVNEQDIGGLTALHWVCANRNYHLFSELIKCPEINVLLKDKNGRLALDHAIAGGHKSIILTLMNFMHVMNDPPR